MDIIDFSQQVTAMQNRLDFVFRNSEYGSQITPNVISTLFKELGLAVEELQVAVEELEQQNEALNQTLKLANTERKRYQDLFQMAPEAHLVTNLSGIIQDGNRLATEMLGVPLKFLIGKPLVLFIDEGNRDVFWTELQRRQGCNYFQDWEMTLNCRDRKSLTVSCLMVATRNEEGIPISLHWVMKDISEQKRISFLNQVQPELNLKNDILLKNCHTQVYVSGELISLQPKILYYIVRGVVKVTTLNEQNQVVLIGLFSRGMSFGSELTSLSIYEACAASDVELISFSSSEVAACSYLNQLVLAGISYRLRKTEELLAISGERQIESRLCRLLTFLKTEVGEPVEAGTLLNIRFTHEDFASACCTTRVTITRLLGKLQQEKKVSFNCKKHIILLPDFDAN